MCIGISGLGGFGCWFVEDSLWGEGGRDVLVPVLSPPSPLFYRRLLRQRNERQEMRGSEPNARVFLIEEKGDASR